LIVGDSTRIILIIDKLNVDIPDLREAHRNGILQGLKGSAILAKGKFEATQDTVVRQLQGKNGHGHIEKR
jgi:hypothetical protein